MKQAEQALLQLPAGYDNEGQKVLEKVEVYMLEQADHYELKKTPLLVRGLAKGDIISIDQQKVDKIVVVKHSGNLAVRVFRKSDIELLESNLTPQAEMLACSLGVRHDSSHDENQIKKEHLAPW